MKTPNVSVLLPVANEPLKYVKLSLRSIINQTYRNLEIIVLVDRPDNKEVVEYIKAEQERDNRIRLHVNQRPLGLTKTLNVGISMASGVYIARMDADDISLPTRIERQVAFMEQNPDYGLCGTKAYFINEEGKLILNPKISLNNNIVTHENIQRAILRFNPFIHSSILLRTQTLEQIGGYNERFETSQDYELWLRVCRRYKCYILPKRLILYRIRTHGISYSKMRTSLKYSLCARYLAITKYGYPKWGIIYLIWPTISYIVPVRIKQIIFRRHLR
ncbi:hypothetical protein TEU_03845 [Thermococcus eurythermalis]|uniref:Glycosyltransferase 2-like domain-containing protein n=1 Tax=Thermococcus eurythermalis TaxID=1505907 RepID=A0A097QSW6_9EURY|nr:glycosyltransferase [Thermococcus eurythermalis]AIU69544.1 hypothetical protein TEU_03845 [Thermococcus eurythermalis]